MYKKGHYSNIILIISVLEADLNISKIHSNKQKCTNDAPYSSLKTNHISDTRPIDNNGVQFVEKSDKMTNNLKLAEKFCSTIRLVIFIVKS